MEMQCVFCWKPEGDTPAVVVIKGMSLCKKCMKEMFNVVKDEKEEKEKRIVT